MRLYAIAVLPASLALLLAGCAVGPDFDTPAPPHASRYTAEPMAPTTQAAAGPFGEAQHLLDGADVSADWWTAFGSPALNQAIATALAGNPSLAEAEARLRQAQHDFAARAGAIRWPAVDAGLDVTRQRINVAAMGITGIPSPGPFTVHGATVQASYLLDLFGGGRRELEALQAVVDYRRYEGEAARLSLIGNVVAAAIEEASVRARIDDTVALADAQRRQVRIADEQVRLGGVAAVTLERQQGELAATEALLPPLRETLAATRHRLAIYLGLPPEAAAEPASGHERRHGHASGEAVPAFRLDELRLPGEVPLALPSTLARRRPDIRAAEALLHRASANIGVATANLYPRLTLSASAGSERLSAGDLLNGINVWSIGGGLMQPVFRGGELRERRRAAVAAYDEARAAYREAVLNGLREVADALQALHAAASTTAARADAAQRAAAVVDIVGEQYRLGGVSQLAWLDAQRQQRQASLALTQARADRLADTAVLLQALGGGWWAGPDAAEDGVRVEGGRAAAAARSP